MLTLLLFYCYYYYYYYYNYYSCWYYYCACGVCRKLVSNGHYGMSALGFIFICFDFLYFCYPMRVIETKSKTLVVALSAGDYQLNRFKFCLLVFATRLLPF